ncbi:MAG: hypothetical protein BZY80_03585 [SAR202 cluster bacterium Io17-Chloro-G2]|nr:MAG: hypothetical protein BZY80_03585 [SAR202 cluster bacterium Io17-Chloro-G2]
MAICDLVLAELTAMFSGAIDCAENNDGIFVLSTPFFYPDRDHIQLYIRQLPDQSYLVSDSGRTMMKLDTYGFELRRSPRRRAMIFQITSSLGVRYDNGRFFVIGEENRLGQKIWDLLTAVHKASDLVFTVTGYTTATFADEFEGFVSESQIQYERGKQLEFVAGTVENVDFWVNHSPVPKAILLLSAGSAGYAVQRSDRVYRTFNELRLASGNIARLSILDDRQDVWTEQVMIRLGHVSTVLNWTDKRRVARELTSQV